MRLDAIYFFSAMHPDATYLFGALHLDAIYFFSAMRPDAMYLFGALHLNAMYCSMTKTKVVQHVSSPKESNLTT